MARDGSSTEDGLIDDDQAQQRPPEGSATVSHQREGPRDPDATEIYRPSSGSGTDANAPTVFGSYQLLAEIGHGGMGIVYRARQQPVGRIVALKMILSGRFASATERQRFEREARLAASLDHPHIVPIHDVGVVQGHAYYTMRWIDGTNLSRQIPTLTADLPAAARLLVSIARAVHAAHRRGLVHRDLKPANILVDGEGWPYVTDFGLARPLSADQELTDTGAILGTPSYMAPEQAAGRVHSLTPAADIYSLGVILYEILTGRPPFRSDNPMETIVQVLELEPVPPRQRRPDVPAALESICLKCLEKSPERRYATAEALAEDLERYLRAEPVLALRGGRMHRLWRSARQQPDLAAHLGTLLLVACLTELNRRVFDGAEGIPYGRIQALIGLWMVLSVLLQSVMRDAIHLDRLRMVWLAVDFTLLTWILILRQAADTPLVVGYAVLIVCVGLWTRVKLVWAATAMAIAGYHVLYWSALRDGNVESGHRFPNVVTAALFTTGIVVAQQVRRFWALSSFCERRPRE